LLSNIAKLFIVAYKFLSLNVNNAPIIGNVTDLLAAFSPAISDIFYTHYFTFSLFYANSYASFNNTINTSKELINTLF
jgi:hypothetical protein